MTHHSPLIAWRALRCCCPVPGCRCPSRAEAASCASGRIGSPWPAATCPRSLAIEHADRSQGHRRSAPLSPAGSRHACPAAPRVPLSQSRRVARCARSPRRQWPNPGPDEHQRTCVAHEPCRRPHECRRNDRCSRTRHSRLHASSPGILTGDPSDADPCDRARTDTSWQAGHRCPTVARPAHKPIAAPSPFCRCRAPTSSRGCRRRRSPVRPARAVLWHRLAVSAVPWTCRPSQPASSGPDRAPRVRISGSADIMAGIRHGRQRRALLHRAR